MGDKATDNIKVSISHEDGGEIPVKPMLVPDLVKATDKHNDLLKPSNNFEPFAGEFHLIELDANGNEVPGTDFSIGEQTFYKVFAPLIGKTFEVKKNPKKS